MASRLVLMYRALLTSKSWFVFFFGPLPSGDVTSPRRLFLDWRAITYFDTYFCATANTCFGDDGRRRLLELHYRDQYDIENLSVYQYWHFVIVVIRNECM